MNYRLKSRKSILDSTRRRVVSGLAVAATAAFAGPALAQFSFSFGGSSNKGNSGTTIDLGKIFEGAKSLFEGFSLDEEDEINIGNKLYGKMIDRNGGAYPNRKVQSSIQRFAEDLLKTTERPSLPWEITVLNDNTVNAWVLPGGKIALNKGLLRYAADESELAAVISHEIGHAELSHGMGQMKTEHFKDGFSSLGKAALASQLSGADTSLSNTIIDHLEAPLSEMLLTGYSRGSEDEADQHILKIFEQTGHDPAKAANFYKTLLQITPPDTEGTTSLFSTHPGTIERIEKIEDAVAGKELSSPDKPPHPQEFAAIKTTFPTRHKFRRQGGAAAPIEG